MTPDVRRRVPAPPTGHPLDLSAAWHQDEQTRARAQHHVADQLQELERSLMRVQSELAAADKDGALQELRADYGRRIDDVRQMLRGMAK